MKRSIYRQPKKKAEKESTAGIVFFVASMMLTVWEIDIYRLTMIPLKTLILVYFISGLLLTVLLWRFAKAMVGADSVLHEIMALIFGTVSFGGIVCFLFMASNYYWADHKEVSEKFAVQESGTLAKGKGGGCGEPYVRFSYQGMRKELVFSCDFEDTIREYKSVMVIHRKGLWGFDVVSQKTLMK